MKRLAIAVIHGIGSEKQFYSVELKHRITEEYIKGGEGRMEEDLLFHEIYWGDLVRDDQSELLDRADYKNELAYKGIRNLFVDYLSTSLAYRTKGSSGFYDAVHARIKDSLRGFAAHRRVDQDSTPLVILAHSFGSVIMSNYIYDMRKRIEEGNADDVSNFESFKTMAGFVTFGSPLAVYYMQGGEFGEPIAKCGDVLPDDLKKRTRWYNFYDKDDIVGYPLKGVNAAYKEAVDGDFEINVGGAATSWNPACHNGYWEDKDFYKPVADYLGELRAPHSFWQ